MSTLGNSNQHQDTELKEMGIQLPILTHTLTTLMSMMDGGSSRRIVGGGDRRSRCSRCSSGYATDDDDGKSDKENNSQHTTYRNRDCPIKRPRDNKTESYHEKLNTGGWRFKNEKWDNNWPTDKKRWYQSAQSHTGIELKKSNPTQWKKKMKSLKKQVDLEA